MTVEYGNATEDRSEIFSDGLLNGSAYVGYSTPLGPIYVGIGWSEDRSALYFLRFGTLLGARSLGGARKVLSIEQMGPEVVSGPFCSLCNVLRALQPRVVSCLLQTQEMHHHRLRYS